MQNVFEERKKCEQVQEDAERNEQQLQEHMFSSEQMLRDAAAKSNQLQTELATMQRVINQKVLEIKSVEDARAREKEAERRRSEEQRRKCSAVLDAFGNLRTSLGQQLQNIRPQSGESGVGLVLRKASSGPIKVSSVIPNSPAAESQIRPGDIMVEVAGVSVGASSKLGDVEKLIAGQEFEHVHMRLRALSGQWNDAYTRIRGETDKR